MLDTNLLKYVVVKLRRDKESDMEISMKSGVRARTISNIRLGINTNPTWKTLNALVRYYNSL